MTAEQELRNRCAGILDKDDTRVYLCIVSDLDGVHLPLRVRLSWRDQAQTVPGPTISGAVGANGSPSHECRTC